MGLGDIEIEKKAFQGDKLKLAVILNVEVEKATF
jgi:hypothetical protein